jgi:hypothetical protein
VTKPCIGRYCECRYHLTPDISAWAIEGYTPSPWAQEVLHTLWVDKRGAGEITEDERAVLMAELQRLADNASAALEVLS